MKTPTLVPLSNFLFLTLFFFYCTPSAAQNASAPFSRQPDNLKEVPLLIRDAASAGAHFERRELFQTDTSLLENHPSLSQVLNHGTVLRLNESVVENTLREKVQSITLPLPDGKGGTVELELVRVDIFVPGFSVKTAVPTTEDLSGSLGIHYRGIVKGDDGSLAAISIFENETMGFFNSETSGHSVVGRLGGNNPSNDHIVYAQKDLKVRQTPFCQTTEAEVTLPASAFQELGAIAGACVRIYIEVNYDLFLNKGNVANATSYVTGLFNQSATLFNNDSVPVSLSEIFVWNAPSPYTGADSEEVLNQFRTTRTSFNGNLAHLLSLQSSYGGRAYRDVICNTAFRYAFSGIHDTYNNVPTYSWSVYVFTHETGHNLGSHHTHACQWNGNNTAIDACGPTAGYPYEGSCSGAPLPPSNGGTIMSYCHLVPSVGINFPLGFGPQPRTLILNRVNAASCLTACGGGGGQELLTNGGFELGYADWSVSGSSQVQQGSYPHAGTWYAFLANANNAFGILYHTYLAIPSSAGSATLSFWLNIVTQETTVGPFDTLYVNLIDGSGNAHRLATYSEADSGSNTAGDYSRRSFDVSAYRGQSVQIQFVGQTDGLLPTIFRIDDVSLLAGSSGQKPDFNTDGYSDILWQNNGTGERRIWLMNGLQPSSSNFLGTVDPQWQMAGTGDFDRDGKVDILWQHTGTGERRIWLMNGLQPTSSNFLATVAPQWQMTGTGDFDRDGKVDILWQHTGTGERRIWLMNGLQPTSSNFLATVAPQWQIAGTGDFDRDGQVDILWQHTGTGERRIWLMNGLQPRSSNFLATVLPTQWNIRNF